MRREGRQNNLRQLAVVVYAAFIGLLLASYLSPLQQILDGRHQITTLEQKLENSRAKNEAMSRKAEELQTSAGIERAARDRYGMIGPGEEVYIVPKKMKSGSGSQ